MVDYKSRMLSINAYYRLGDSWSKIEEIWTICVYLPICFTNQTALIEQEHHTGF